MPAGEGAGAQQQHPAYRLVVERFAEPRGVTQDQPLLERGNPIRGDANTGEVPESGVHSVHRAAGVEDAVHRVPRRFDLRPRRLREHARCATTRHRIELFEPERRAVDDDGGRRDTSRFDTHVRKSDVRSRQLPRLRTPAPVRRHPSRVPAVTPRMRESCARGASRPISTGGGHVIEARIEGIDVFFGEKQDFDGGYRVRSSGGGGFARGRTGGFAPAVGGAAR